MFESIRKLWSIFTPKEKRKVILLYLGIVGVALFEVAGIGSIMPFIAIASNPDLIHTNKYLSYVYQLGNFQSQKTFLIFLGVVVLLILVIGNTLKAIVTYAQFQFAAMRKHSFSLRLLKNYLYQPYHFFLNQNSADLTKNIIVEVFHVMDVVTKSLDMFSKLVVSIFIIILLLFVDVQLALLILAVLSTSYALIYVLIRRKLSKLSAERVIANRMRFKALSEAFGGIKDVKLLGLETLFMEEYVKPSKQFVRNEAISDVLGDLPKYALETIAFGGILLIVIYLILSKGNFRDAIPLVGLYAYAGYRMMPSFQSIFKGVSRLKGYLSSVNLIYDQMMQPVQIPASALDKDPPLAFTESIQVDDMSFRYPSSKDFVLKHISLNIPKNSTIGFVGATGSGKTTLADILLGLLEVQEGTVRIDGTPLRRDTLRAWQKHLGYVPQQIYLMDESIAQNIAFGVPKEDISMEAVERAARLANIHDFIVKELPQGYHTVVGERGIRLSGGQRQRVGIARALYRDPNVLIFDEATSALDGITEDAILEAIHNLSHKKTIIMIAHRLTTVRECDTLFFFDHGVLIDQGTYNDLYVRNATFRKMAGENWRTDKVKENIFNGD
ncbi:MAG TPA: ABC transporter ATP-binding protein [Spirochaetales bacterium]|nr:ABC transporter ATP-binding protein [Spirochaetales bacterium]